MRINFDELVTIAEAARRLGISEGVLHHRKQRSKDFPSPKGNLWNYKEILTWHKNYLQSRKPKSIQIMELLAKNPLLTFDELKKLGIKTSKNYFLLIKSEFNSLEEETERIYLRVSLKNKLIREMRETLRQKHNLIINLKG